LDWILKLYYLSSKFRIFNYLSSKLVSQKLNQAVLYYNYNNEDDRHIFSINVVNASIIVFLLIFFSIFLALSYINLYYAILIGLTFSILISKKIYYYLIVQFNLEFESYLQFLDLVYQDLLIIIKSTGTLFDFFQYVSNSSYPIISEQFRYMLKKINMGESPEDLLLNYLNIIPNETFRENILSFLSSNQISNSYFKELPEFSLEIGYKYEKYTSQLDSRLTALITVNIFLPILTMILFSFYASTIPFLYLILIPSHITLLLIMKNLLIKKGVEILGTELQHDAKEFNTLTNFLILFSNNLRQMNSPERAMYNSLLIMKKNITNTKFLNFNNLLLIDIHFDELWNRFTNFFENKQIRVILNLIGRMLKKSSPETGIRIQNILFNLESNKKLILKRKILLNSLQFKSFILLIILSCLIGLLSNLMPFIGHFFQFMNSLNFYSDIIQISVINSFIILITFSIIIFYTSYTILKLLNSKNYLIISIINLCLYWLFYYFTWCLLNFILNL